MTFTVDDFKMAGHFNYGAKGGESQYRGTINCPTHILHGRAFWRITVTPRTAFGGWGKGRTRYYVGDDKRGFADIKKLIEHYNLPPLAKAD